MSTGNFLSFGLFLESTLIIVLPFYYEENYVFFMGEKLTKCNSENKDKGSKRGAYSHNVHNSY